MVQQPYLDLGRLSVEVSRSHVVRHTALSTTPLDEGLAWPIDIQYSQEKNIHVPSRSWTHNPSKRVALDHMATGFDFYKILP
jgi:hypothetical protein